MVHQRYFYVSSEKHINILNTRKRPSSRLGCLKDSIIYYPRLNESMESLLKQQQQNIGGS